MLEFILLDHCVTTRKNTIYKLHTNYTDLRHYSSTQKSHKLIQLSFLSQSLVQEVGILLGCLAILDVSLPVQHPCWDLELQRLADNCHDFVHFISGEFSSALVQVNVALLANLWHSCSSGFWNRAMCNFKQVQIKRNKTIISVCCKARCWRFVGPYHGSRSVRTSPSGGHPRSCCTYLDKCNVYVRKSCEMLQFHWYSRRLK